MYTRIAFIIPCLFLNFQTAHAQQVLSVNPLYTEQAAILLPETERTWKNPDYNLSITIKQTGDNFYLLRYKSSTDLSQYEGVFVSFGNTIFLDLVPMVPPTLGDNDYRSQLLPEHSFYKIKMEKDSLHLAGLNYGWINKQLAKNKSLLTHTWVDGGLLLTSSTKELKQFIQDHINEPGFFDESISFAAQHEIKKLKKEIVSPTTKNNLHKYNQPCIPVFPHKDGWLGGDADVSVPINDSQSLFIFGDTYVAKKNQDRKSKELKMVSSTVAVSSCLPGGKQSVKYYWRNMYSNRPEPIFKSFTSRYNLWANCAFIYKNSLYVLMQKSGPKKDAAPDDIFNFNIIGLTLAKVVNPSGTTPDKWNVAYIPFSFFDSSISTLHITLAKEGNYLYWFAENKEKTRLFRVNLDFIDSPANHFEYYSVAHTWKPGIKADDMDIILSAAVGSTINYHDDLKKWLMVCGPGLLNNKISIRTSSSLTGPWSDEKVVYECPEITPGSTSYNKSNFCYMGRECIQNYDKLNHTIIVTYDINNSDFFQINSNPKIYTPKVIAIPLEKYGIQ
jgi:hypothetical protein